MSEKQLEALMSWVKATIDVKIEEAFGRDSLHEDVIEIECRKRLYVALGLREEEAMSTATELLRRTIDDLELQVGRAIDEIRTYLAAEPEADEPVAWIHCQGEDYEELHTWSLTPECVSVGWTQYPLYRHPPKPEPARKPMTDEEMEKQYEIDKEYFGESVMRAFYNGVRFAEKHHGIGINQSDPDSIDLQSRCRGDKL